MKGETSIFRIQTDLYLKNWVQTLEYDKIKGNYLSNLKGPENIGLSIGDEFLILPDLKTVTYRGVSRYKFNPNFSLKTLTTQTPTCKMFNPNYSP